MNNKFTKLMKLLFTSKMDLYSIGVNGFPSREDSYIEGKVVILLLSTSCKYAEAGNAE